MERPTFTSTRYIHFKSRAEKCVCNLPPCIPEMSPSLLVSSSRNHIKQDSLKMAFYVGVKCATTVNFMMKCLALVMTFSDDSV